MPSDLLSRKDRHQIVRSGSGDEVRNPGLVLLVDENLGEQFLPALVVVHLLALGEGEAVGRVDLVGHRDLVRAAHIGEKEGKDRVVFQLVVLFDHLLQNARVQRRLDVVPHLHEMFREVVGGHRAGLQVDGLDRLERVVHDEKVEHALHLYLLSVDDPRDAELRLVDVLYILRVPRAEQGLQVRVRTEDPRHLHRVVPVLLGNKLLPGLERVVVVRVARYLVISRLGLQPHLVGDGVRHVDHLVLRDVVELRAGAGVQERVENLPLRVGNAEVRHGVVVKGPPALRQDAVEQRTEFHLGGAGVRAIS